MAYKSYIKLWENEFDNIVSKKDKMQDNDPYQLKLELHDTYKKDFKITTNFEPINNENIIIKAYLDEHLSKIEGQISYIKKDYNEFKILYNKQSIEEILNQRAVRTTIQKLYDRGKFDNCDKTDKLTNIFDSLQDVDLIQRK